MSDQEKQFLDLFTGRKGNFYVIGIHRDMEDVSGLLMHETAHGLYYTDPEYREEVACIVSEFDVEDIKTGLRSK